MLSPSFKVREFAVNDVNIFPISIGWKSVDSSDDAFMNIAGLDIK